ncbi:MAG: 6-phosphofructokinase [Planctomycetes bacterium]|nr:6-phosphofructokinase [Planctomycetota bacterium]
MAKPTKKKRLGILVGGGPAPGINGVIGAATIEALNRGLEVVGILDGFKWLARGDARHMRTLSMDDVEKERFRGGAMLRTSRENPTKDPQKMANVVKALKKLNISYLITIGGDDTAFSASTTSRHAKGAIKVAHVPKTIDNDLPLPQNAPTFGYNTARDVGGRLIRGLMEDAWTTQRWYLVVAMGRSAGHLALGMGISGGAPLTVIPEEFTDSDVSVGLLCDIIEGSIFKSMAIGRDYGVAILAEGVGELVADELASNPLVVVEKDEHGHLRLAEVPFGLILKRELQGRAKERGQKITIVDTTIGYELRCADPIPFDVEYVQQLGSGAVRYLLGIGEKSWGRGGALISVQEGELVPIPFTDILDPKTGKTTVRRVNINSDQYRLARSYMIRVEEEDLKSTGKVKALASAAGLTRAEFKKRYAKVVQV